MRVINARNVSAAWMEATMMVTRKYMIAQESRAGRVLVSDRPVTTAYQQPTERVLLDPVRDANPFFHLFEGLWMLAGRDDAKWLDRFVGDYSARFAEAGGVQHGAYGKRWRGHFVLDDGGVAESVPRDQLDVVVKLLRANPDDRQAVIAMWDPTADLGVPNLKDRPCNTHIYLRLRDATTRDAVGPVSLAPALIALRNKALDMTVCCRSNDIVWGCYGANAVHMSMLQEYLAARIGVGVGVYYQVSNNWHVYESALGRMKYQSAAVSNDRPYPGTLPLVDDPDSFDDELHRFLQEPESVRPCANKFFSDTARHMWQANEYRRAKDYPSALAAAARVAAPDWRTAATEWLQRRLK